MNRTTRRARWASTALLLAPLATLHAADSDGVSFSAITSPIILRGDATTAYRDPAAIYHQGWFRLYFTMVEIEPDEQPFSYTAWSKSRDMVNWTEPVVFTRAISRSTTAAPATSFGMATNGSYVCRPIPVPTVSSTVTKTRASGRCAVRIWKVGANRNCSG